MGRKGVGRVVAVVMEEGLKDTSEVSTVPLLTFCRLFSCLVLAALSCRLVGPIFLTAMGVLCFQWSGPVGLRLNSLLYIDCSGEIDQVAAARLAAAVRESVLKPERTSGRVL